MRLRQRKLRAESARRQCGVVLDKLRERSGGEQMELFGAAQSVALSARDLEAIFARGNILRVRRFAPEHQIRLVARRAGRLERVLELLEGEIRRVSLELQSREGVVVRRARVVLATMTNVYISKILEEERFDAVIVEEAGMAILPTLFYCATLARSKAIMVGDPKQLPPIIQSRDTYVQRAMGRSIFEVTAPEPHHSNVVVMLDEQYRMHPSIGDLVSLLFYEGRLRNGIAAEAREAIVAREPFAGMPLVVIDTEGRAMCAAHPGSGSRFNEESARICAEIATRAVCEGVESVAVITPYVEQSRLIRRLLAGHAGKGHGVECSTVHRFQGNERDLVILDLVDAAPLSPGILLSDFHAGSSSRHLLNVSISRARGKLVIVSDMAYFRACASGSLVTELLEKAAATGKLVPYSQLHA